MSSLINIYIPTRFGLPTGKEARYTGANVLNTVRQTGTTLAGNVIRSSLYQGEMYKPIAIYEQQYFLRTDGNKKDNNVILHIGETAHIEIIDARIYVQKANEVKPTPLVNRAGTVKELIQAKDYAVTISGSLIGDRQGKFPLDELIQLNEILSNTGNIGVESVYLDIFHIKKLVLKSADFNQETLAYFNVMPFRLMFDSDTDYDFLEIK